MLGCFQWQAKAYRRIDVGEQVEVISLLGDIPARPGAAWRSTPTP